MSDWQNYQAGTCLKCPKKTTHISQICQSCRREHKVKQVFASGARKESLKPRSAR